MYTFNVPTKDFKKTEEKDLKVKILYKSETSATYMRGQRTGALKFEDLYYRVDIPKFIIDKVKNVTRQYTKDGIGIKYTYQEGSHEYEEKYNFKNFIEQKDFKALVREFNSIVNDAIYFQESEDLEKFNKVIFVNSTFSNKEKVDSYNFGIAGNQLDLGFRFFVAYKIKRRKNLITQYWQVADEDDEDVVTEYMAIKQREIKHGLSGDKRKRPMLTGREITTFKEIPWTQEREDFFQDIENKISKLSTMVKEFVNDIDSKNIDYKITNNTKLLLLEDKNEH